MVERIDPFVQTYDEKPKTLPEKAASHRASNLVVFGTLTAANYSAYAFNETYHDLLTRYPLLTSVIGGAIYAISVLADNRSTIAALDAMEEASQAGVHVAHSESSPVLRNISTSEEFKKSKKRKVIDGSVILASTISPLISLPLASVKHLAAANNRRIAYRYRRAAEIARQR